MTVKDLKKKAPKGEFLAYINKEEAAALKRAGGSGHLVNGIPSFVGSDYSEKGDANTSGYQGGNRGRGGYQGTTGKTNQASDGGTGGSGGNFNPNVTAKGTPVRTGDLSTALQTYNHNAVVGNDQPMGPPIYSPKEQIKIENQNLFYNKKPKYPSYIPKYIETAANFNRKPNRKYFYEKVLKNNAQNLNYTDLEDAYDKYMEDRMAGYTDAMGNVSPNYRLENGTYFENNQGGANQDIISNFQSPVVEDVEDVEDLEDTGPEYRIGLGGQDVVYDSYGTPGYRTTRAAEGGIMGTRARRAMGGIMERVDKRQQFFLGGIGKAVGKVVGGVAKAAGKVLSSDLGKAALTAAAFYYGGGGKFSPGGMKSFSPGNFFSKSNPLLFSGKMVDGVSKQVFNPFKFAGLTTLIGAGMGPAKVDTLEGFSDRGGKMKDSKGNEAEGPQIRAEIDDAYESGDPERIAAIEKYYAFLPPTKKFMPYQEFGDEGYRTTVATGGRIGFNGGGTTITLMDGTTVKIPSGSYNSSGSLKDKIYSSSKGDLLREEIIRKLSFANGGRIGKAEGGLLDLGGMEKDYRAEGGFVPIGEYEKKDDVPARLSVNEFVMTADAVRGAGQGDIDKGAEIMENMMKNLENGGTVSEESQGNKGAQNMFKTSERLGAVI
jgi:hypothetical protein